MVETKIAEILAKYNAMIAVIAILANALLFVLKKKAALARRLNSVMPFVAAIVLSFCIYSFMGVAVEEIAKNAITAGGLASVLYSVTGGYYSEEKEDLKKLLGVLLKNIVSEDKIDGVIADFFEGTNDCFGENSESLITVKISDLIKNNLCDEADEERVELVTTIFVQAWHKLKAQTKNA